MSQSHIVVSLGPLRLDVAHVHKGEIISRASAWLDRVTIEQAWNTDLHSLDSTLDQLLQAVEARPGMSGVAEYASPETSVDVFTVPENEDPTLGATKMLADASNIDLSTEPFVTLPLDAPSLPGQHHVLGATDLDLRVDAVRNWLRRVGLRPVAFVPIDAAAVQVAVNRARQLQGSSPSVLVHLGERRTVIVLTHMGELKLVRCVGIGTSVLVDAVAEATAAEGQTIDSLHRKQSFESLRQMGISLAARGPKTEASDRLLPFLNPALQRYIVEIRQTLRFGLTPQDAARAVLQCFGAGSALPGLTRTIAGQLDISVPDEQSQPASEYSHTVDVGLSLQVDPSAISLMPSSHRKAAQSRRAMGGLVAGAAGALLLVAGDAAFTYAKMHEQQVELQRLTPIHHELEGRDALYRQVTALRGQNNEIYRTIRQGLSDQPDWKLVLSELADATDERMKLSDVTLSASNSGATMSLRGALASDPAAPADSPQAALQSPMTHFLQTLASAAAVESAELGETRTAEIQGAPVEVFAADVRLRGLPYVIPAQGGR